MESVKLLPLQFHTSLDGFYLFGSGAEDPEENDEENDEQDIEKDVQEEYVTQ